MSDPQAIDSLQSFMEGGGDDDVDVPQEEPAVTDNPAAAADDDNNNNNDANESYSQAADIADMLEAGQEQEQEEGDVEVEGEGEVEGEVEVEGEGDVEADAEPDADAEAADVAGAPEISTEDYEKLAASIHNIINERSESSSSLTIKTVKQKLREEFPKSFVKKHVEVSSPIHTLACKQTNTQRQA